MIAIIDYDAGNIRSVEKALVFLGEEAKVTRDRYMIELDAKYPMYGFARNKGYGTAEHIAALKKYGPCPLHRRSFIGKILGEDYE